MSAEKWRLLNLGEIIQEGDQWHDHTTNLWTGAHQGVGDAVQTIDGPFRRRMTPAEAHAEELLEATNALRAAAWVHVRAVEHGMSRSAVDEAARHTRHAISRAEDLVADLFPA